MEKQQVEPVKVDSYFQCDAHVHIELLADSLLTVTHSHTEANVGIAGLWNNNVWSMTRFLKYCHRIPLNLQSQNNLIKKENISE